MRGPLCAALLVLLLQAPAGAAPPDGGSDGGSPDLGPRPALLGEPLSLDLDSSCAPSTAPPSPESRNDGLTVARRYVALLLAGRLAEAQLLHDHEGGRRPDLATLTTLAAGLQSHGPVSLLVVAPVVQTNAETTTYYLSARFADGDITFRVSVDHAGHVAGAAVSSGGPVLSPRLQRYDRYDQYHTRNTLSLPFRGAWTAINTSPGGGNGHYQNANQRFAVDFLVRRGTGSKRHSYRGAGRDNEDYYAYGQPVLAPADGKVVQVVDGVPDNTPGQVDVYFRMGNMVVLELGRGEYAYLCHLQPGSAAVHPGERVRRGQVLARCGNSGNSTEPHLHFQLGDGPQITRAGSLPVYFRRCFRNGQAATDVLPGDGEELSSEK